MGSVKILSVVINGYFGIVKSNCTEFCQSVSPSVHRKKICVLGKIWCMKRQRFMMIDLEGAERAEMGRLKTMRTIRLFYTPQRTESVRRGNVQETTDYKGSRKKNLHS